MSEPIFLTLDEIHGIHQRGIEKYGGTMGVRDMGLLQSAVEQPGNIYYYGKGDLYEMASGYAYHIAEVQAYLDGNKRVAITATITFLKANGLRPRYNSNEIYDAIIAIAKHRLDRAGLAAILRRGAETS